MTVLHVLNEADIERAYDHESHDDCPGWLGFGYLGERLSALDASDAEIEPISAEQLHKSDAAVLREANRLGWDEHRLFIWLNSRDGRHYADAQLRADAPDASGRLR